MIKIEFKHAKPANERITNTTCLVKDFYTDCLFPCSTVIKDILNITFGCPSELVPSRDEVLQQLGISKEQDEEMQQKYK